VLYFQFSAGISQDSPTGPAHRYPDGRVKIVESLQ
jgi:hypothetical protein